MASKRFVTCVPLTSKLSGFEISAMQFLYTFMWHDDPVCCTAAICSSLSALDASQLFGVCSHKKTNKRPARVSVCNTTDWVLDFLQHHPDAWEFFHILPQPWQVLGSNPPKSSRALHWNDISHPGLQLLLDFVLILKHTVRFTHKLDTWYLYFSNVGSDWWSEVEEHFLGMTFLRSGETCWKESKRVITSQ